MTEKLNYIESYTLIDYFEHIKEYDQYEREVFSSVLKTSLSEIFPNGNLNYKLHHKRKSLTLLFSEIEYYVSNPYYRKGPMIYLFTQRISYTDSISEMFLDKNVYYYV